MSRDKNKLRFIKESPEPFADFKKTQTSSPFSFSGFAVVFISFLFLFPVLAFFWSLIDSNATIHTLTLAYLAFFIGKTLELRKIAGSWKTVAFTMIGSLLASLYNFAPYKKEVGYSLQRHLDNWPIVFALIFVVIVVAFFSKKLTVRIGEGITLLHSLTLMYFLADRFQSGTGSGWWVALCVLPLCYSLIHALTYTEITKEDRLYLSIWSSLTMAVFAFVYVQNVLQMDNVEKLISENRFGDGAYVFFEYFLLGASGAYIAQNALMLLGYLPGRNRFFNAAYFKDVRELNKNHIERYSSEQVDKREAFFVLFLAGGLLTANYYLKFFEPSFVICVCLIVVPIFVGLLGRLIKIQPTQTEP